MEVIVGGSSAPRPGDNRLISLINSYYVEPVHLKLLFGRRGRAICSHFRYLLIASCDPRRSDDDDMDLYARRPGLHERDPNRFGSIEALASR